MAFVHGKSTAILLDDADVSAWFRDADLSAAVDTADVTTFSNDWKRHIPGQASATVMLDGLYDPDFDAFPKVDAGSVLTIGPGGLSAVGSAARLVSIVSTTYTESSPVGDVVAATYSAVADDPVGYGVLLHPLTQETDDGNGSTHTGPVGGTSNGAVIHYHVSAVSDTDELDLTIEDSANGSDWTELSGAASATYDAPGAERVVVTGAVRRYLRVVFDITGTGDREVTFAAAIARL